jgi:hypothetical protein
LQELQVVQRPNPRSPPRIRRLLQVRSAISSHLDATLADISILAAAAAKINAQIQAKKGIQHVDVPPIQSTLSPAPKSASPAASGSGNSAALVNGEMYIADGDYIRDIEVNDLRNRYTLTKGSTQKMVNTPCVNIPLIHQALLYLDIAKFASRQNPSFPFHFSSTASKQAGRQAERKYSMFKILREAHFCIGDFQAYLQAL